MRFLNWFCLALFFLFILFLLGPLYSSSRKLRRKWMWRRTIFSLLNSLVSSSRNLRGRRMRRRSVLLSLLCYLSSSSSGHLRRRWMRGRFVPVSNISSEFCCIIFKRSRWLYDWRFSSFFFSTSFTDQFKFSLYFWSYRSWITFLTEPIFVSDRGILFTSFDAFETTFLNLTFCT